MRLADFERCVEEALKELPRRVQNALNNVAFVVEQRARRPRRGEGVVRSHGALLGLYEGVPLISRGSGYQWVLPDKITLFQETIEEVARAGNHAVAQVIRETVWHEVAHHLGMSEREVRAWELRRRKKRATPSRR